MIAKLNMNFAGWGIVGEPQPGVLVPGPAGQSIDVHGYSVDAYFEGDHFLGPDSFGIVPVFIGSDGQFPADAVKYPHLA